ncbi:MAG: hypothetical protein B0W54_16425 [Cellvibrio sp. 79]|nr:MAG: hypothetical protein B0W54_16425 [Cellvibrio sp. 79]
MKYLRALLISLVVLGGTSAPAAMAYVEFYMPSAFTWDRTIDRDSGGETNGLFMNPSITISYFFPDLNLDFEQPLAAPLTLSLDRPKDILFYNGFHTEYHPRLANADGSLTFDVDWTIKEWDLTLDFILTDYWYGTFTSTGPIGRLESASLVMHYDDFRTRPFFEPQDISEYSIGYVDGFFVGNHGITVPESAALPLLLLCVLPLIVGRALRNRLWTTVRTLDK